MFLTETCKGPCGVTRHVRIEFERESFNLHVNETKTEEHRIKRGGNDNWKKCKYLGTLLDTNSDISRRKCLAILAFNKLKIAFNSKLTIKNKIRIFNAYIESIFLYNAELWTLTKKLAEDINIFQRSVLRKILKIAWPKKISNKDLYSKTKTVEWSKKIHKKETAMDRPYLFRLPEDAPAKQALSEDI